MINIEIKNGIKSTEGYGLFVTFPYNADIIDIIRNQPMRAWHADTKEWELPLSRLTKLLDIFNQNGFDVTVDVDDVNIINPKIELPEGFEYKTEPFNHQKEGVLYGLEHSKWLLGDEQGLGKTKQIIDLAVAKKLQGCKHCLIICGVNGLKWNWVNEVATHSNEKAWILGQRVNRNGKTVVDSNQDKYDDLVSLANGEGEISDCYFIITNVETLRYKIDTGETRTVRGKTEKVYKFPITDILSNLCNDGTIEMVAFDEIHKVKNISSQQGSQLLDIQAKTMIAMSGTPLMNQPMDLYAILKWLGAESHSYYAFKNHYCEMGGYGNYQIVGYKNLEELQEQLDTVMLRRLKSDVLDLPEKIRVSEYVEMTAKQAQIYKEVSMEVQSNIDQIKQATNPLSELIRLRQATGYTGILSSKIQESAKLDRMEELVEDAIENGKQVVIFSNWTQITTEVEKRLNKKYPLEVSLITGDTKDEDRQRQVNKFQDGLSKIIVGTIGAMGTGLTLTAGTVEIFMDEPWNMANKEQAEDRCHRVGTTENITIYTLLCKNTIDERVHELVEKKGRMSNAIVDGAIVNMDKGELVDYLLS